NETITTAVPLTIEMCKKNPQSELSKIKAEIKKELSK
ncbi:MAG: acid-resistance protein, partial [Citrobacter sp.]